MPVTTSDLKLADTIGKDFQFFWFSRLLDAPIYAGSMEHKIGTLSDLVFQLAEPHPTAAGIYIEHGWGKPTEFIPWGSVIATEQRAVVVTPPEHDTSYPPFVDQPGWMLLKEHLMGRTILDTDGRRVEVVNDVHLLYSKGRMIIVHVDVSFNGFLRKWGLGSVHWIKDRLISWRYVQPFSVEDAVTTDSVSLSVAKERALELPGEDLADVLEMLSGEEQEAFFSALDTEKAAETLVHAEPRAKRQLIEDLPGERARAILEELSVPQLADLFLVLPHDDMTELMPLLTEDKAKRVQQLLSEQEVHARDLMSPDYLSFKPEVTVGEALREIRRSTLDPDIISYIYVVTEEKVLMGVIDIRELILARDEAALKDVMSTSVVGAEDDRPREDLEDMFVKYHYRMIPVVDAQDHLLGVIRYNDLAQSISEQKT